MLKFQGEPDDDEPDVHITSAEELKKMKLIAEEDEEANNDAQQEIYSTGAIEPVKSQNSPRI